MHYPGDGSRTYTADVTGGAPAEDVLHAAPLHPGQSCLRREAVASAHDALHTVEASLPGGLQSRGTRKAAPAHAPAIQVSAF